MKNDRKEQALRALALFALLAALVSHLGCTFPHGSRRNQDRPDIRPPDNAEHGVLSVEIPRPVVASSLSDDLAAATDTYEVYIYTNGMSVLEVLTLTPASPAAQIALAAGDYGVIALAGRSSGGTACLTAAAKNTDTVTISPDTVTSVSLTLAAVSHAITIPTEVEAGEPVSISVTGDTGGDFVLPLLTGSSSTERPYFQDTEGSTISADTVTGDVAQAWSAQFNFTAPTTTGTQELNFRGSRLVLSDPPMGLTQLKPEDLGGSDWRWLSAVVIDADDTLGHTVYTSYNVTPVTTGLEVTLSW